MKTISELQEAKKAELEVAAHHAGITITSSSALVFDVATIPGVVALVFHDSQSYRVRVSGDGHRNKQLGEWKKASSAIKALLPYAKVGS